MFLKLKKKFRSVLAEVVRNQVLNIFEERNYDIKIALQKRALEDSVSLILEEQFPIERTFIDRFALLNEAVKNVQVNGLYLEFGVYKGTTINYISKLIGNHKIYGFDSFKGLNEPWIFRGEGAFGDIDGQLPRVNENVTLIKGYFDKSLPDFIKSIDEPVAFLHIDSDLYSSAIYILNELKLQIVTGTIITFDEYFNYPNWQQGEYKAWQEFTKNNNIQYEIVGFTFQRRGKFKSGNQVCFKII